MIDNNQMDRSSWLDVFYEKRTVWFLFIVSLLFTIFISYRLHEEHKMIFRNHFYDAVAQTNKLIEKKILSHEALLKDAIGLYESSELLTQEEWHHFMTTQGIPTDYPATQEIGMIFFTKSYNFSLNGTSVLAGKTLTDLFTDPLTRDTIQRTMTTGTTALCVGTLFPHLPDIDLMMVLPIYQNDNPNLTRKQKRVIGVVYATINMKFLFQTLAGDSTQQLDFAIYNANDKHLLYRSQLTALKHTPKHHAMSTLTIAGQDLGIEYASTPAFESKMHSDVSMIAAPLGLLLNILLLTVHLAFIRGRKNLKETNDELNMLHTLINESNDMVFIIRIDDGYVKYINQTATKMLGYTLEEIRTIGINSFRRPLKKDDSFAEHLEELKKAKRLIDYAILTRKDGSEFSIEANVRLVHYNGVDYNIALVRDITESAIYNQQIAKSSMLLNEAQKLAKLGSWRLNLLTNELEWSDEIYDIFEIDRELHDPTYEGFLNAIHPEDRKLVNTAYTNSVKEHTSYNYVHRLLMLDGRIKYVREQGENFYDENATPLESRGTVHDITEQQELKESLIIAKEVAERANKAKSDFLANMSHEIRTPLNGVIGLTDLVLQTNLQPLQRDYLNKAETAAKALLSVLNSILDYSKIEAHKLILESTLFDIREILDNIKALFSYKAQEKHLSFEIHVDDTVPKTVVGDPLRLQQVLSNLVGNSLKFTDSGYVRISISATTQEKNHKLKFDISDSGIGMTPEQQKELFQPFSQVDASFTRKFGGTGLGLMITKELVELMGGKITIQSSPDHGSTFSFTIVYDNDDIIISQLTKKVPAPNEINPLPSTKTIHILIVEDNDLNQLVATERLKQMGITSSIANNGLEALEMVKQHEYNAILMDLQMPVMDGLEATREIRKLKGKENLPIIALSAAVLQDDLELARKAGMNDHIAKPIDKVALQNVLAKWLSV
jgi:PAS domain S-box-containing protein